MHLCFYAITETKKKEITLKKVIELNMTIEKSQHKSMLTSRENYYLSVYTIVVHRHCLLYKDDKEEI